LDGLSPKPGGDLAGGRPAEPASAVLPLLSAVERTPEDRTVNIIRHYQPEPTAMEDLVEVRLLYVGLTRVRQKLYICQREAGMAVTI
jgi:hypothetical protein